MCDWLSVSVSDPAVVRQQLGEIAYWNKYETSPRLNRSGSFTQLNTKCEEWIHQHWNFTSSQ